MSAIREFAAKQAEYQSRLQDAINGVRGDIAHLNDKINELQSSPGSITPEDQALLDEIDAAGEKLVTDLEAVDALTPPPTPSE